MKSLGLHKKHVRALFALLLLLGFSVSAEPAKNAEEKRLLFVPSSRRTPPRRDSQLLVSLANGNLVALDQETGEALWTFETGLPLVSATPPGSSGEAGVEEVNGEDTKPKDSIFPGIDGSLYAYRPSHGSDGSRIEKLPVTVSELVQQSPAPTQDGSLMMGSQHTTVFLIDGASGQLLRTFYDFDGELAQLRSATAASLGLPQESEVDLSNAVVIGRKDYVVRSVHPEFGEQWNVTWSRVQRLSELEVVRPPATDAAGISLATPAAGSEAQQHQQQLPSVVGLVVGPDFSLRSFDPGSGWERWTHRFDAVPIAAYSAAGRRLDLLDPGQRRALEVGAGGGDGGGGGVREERKELPGSHASTALQPLPRQRPPVGGVDGSALPGVQPGEGGGMLSPEMCSPGRGDEVLVGLMGGSLFGVPATHFTFDVSQQLCQVDTSGAADPGASTPLPALPSTQPYQPRRDDLEEVRGGGPSPAPPPDSPSSVAVAIPGDGPDVDAQCDSSDPAAKCSVPLGMYRLSKAGSTPGGRAGMMLLPASANESAEREARRAQQDMAGASAGGGGGRRVTLVVVGAMGGSVAVLVVVVVVRGRGGRGQQPLQAGTAHGVGVELSGASGGEEGLPLLAEGRGEAGRGGKGSRRKAGGLRAKHLSNRVKGHLLQQLAEGGEGEEEGRGGSSGSASRSATQGEEGGQTGGGGAVGAAGGEGGGGGGGGGEGLQGVDRQDSLSPSSAAVQRGMQDTSMQRRQLRDGKVCVGRLQVGPAILGYGSGGTVVFEGEMDGRPVAVKRMLRQFYELAKKEIGALILSDEHPNVVRVFGLEEDHEFCYLALERCKGTLAEAMQDPASRSMFVDQEGLPTPLALRVARDVGRGLEALHDRDIVHRDLKPHNVLMTEGGRAKLSDMGLSKRLVPEQSSFESVGSGGSSGWQAPEQLVSRSGGSARQTRSVDVFSYGLLVHYCLTGGAHPFGESYERDANILMGRSTMKHLQQQPLAADLVQGMVAAAPGARPSVASVMCHPLWWDVPRRLAFLIDVSDRVEGEDRAEDRSMYMSLETLVEAAVGPGRSWAAAMDSGLVNNLGKYRRYNYGSLRDLLRVIRNKHNHFRELPPELQNKLGPLPEGFLAYFEKRYPGLLSTCFYFALRWCAEEPVFQKYFSPASQTLLEKLAPRELRQELPAAQHAKRAAADAPAPPPSLPVVVEEGEGEREGGRGKRGRRDKAVAVEAAAAAVPARPKMNGAPRAKPSAEVSEFGNRSRSRSPSPSPLAAAAALPTPPQARLPAAGAQAGMQPPDASADAVARGQAADLDAADSPPDSPPIYIPSPLTASGGSSDTDSPVSPLPLRSTPSPPPLDISPSGSPKSIRGAGDALPSSPLASPGSAGSVSLRRISTGRSPTPSSTATQEPPPADNSASGAVTSAFAAAAAARGFNSDSDSDCDPGSRANGDTPPRPSHSRDDSLGVTLPASPLIGGTPKTWSGGYEPPPLHHDLVRQATDTLSSAASLSHMVPAPGRALSGALTGALSLLSSGVLPDSVAARNTGGGGGGGGFTLSPPRPHPGRSLSRQSPTAMPVFGKRGPATLEPQLPQEDVSPVRLEKDGHLLVAMFPRRPGHPVCDFFMKTGHCKFGEMCKFDHPPNYAVRLNQAGLPVRPGEPTCSFYQRYGGCKFGASCKFNHPPAHPTPQQ